MSPLLPWLLVPLGWFYRISLHNKSWLAVAVPLLIGAIVSAITLRTAERHGRDDYRQATALVVQDLELGRTVQWNADMNTPRFYAYRKGGMALVNAIQIMESEKPETLFTVDVIYINRPDLRYPGLEHGRIFSEQGFLLDEKLNGFEIWRSKYNR